MNNNTKKQIQAAKLVPDFALWARVSKTIEPVNLDLAKELQNFDQEIIPLVRKTVKPIASVNTLKTTTARMPNSQAFQLTGLDRRQQQRLLRGRVEIDARIDLHGETVESARMKLWHFLLQSAELGCRTVLVITGKGSSQFSRHTLHGRGYHESESRNGRLRNELPDWLHDHEFRVLVSGFQPAHPKHGGGGAVYIRLRNLAKQGHSGQRKLP